MLLLAHLTWLSVVLWIAIFVLMIATFVRALGGPPTTAPDELTAGVIEPVAG